MTHSMVYPDVTFPSVADVQAVMQYPQQRTALCRVEFGNQDPEMIYLVLKRTWWPLWRLRVLDSWRGTLEQYVDICHINGRIPICFTLVPWSS